MTDPPQTRGLSGEALAARREELKMTLAQVAGDLLLSQRHVEALEADEPSAFYNRNFYDQARRRYAVLLGVAVADTPGAAESAGADSPPAPIPVTPAGPVGAKPADVPSKGLPIKPLGLAMLAAAAGIYVIWQGQSLLEPIRDALWTTPVATAPSAPAQDDASLGSAPAFSAAQPLPAPPDGSANSAPRNDSPPPDAAPVRSLGDEARPGAAAEVRESAGAEQQPTAAEPAFLFEAQRLCWVFARQIGGKETKVTLKAGQSLALPGNLNYLAVGDLSAVRILVDGERRDVGTFSSDGRVARLGPAELRSLRAGSGPALPNSTPERSDVEVGHP